MRVSQLCFLLQFLTVFAQKLICVYRKSVASLEFLEDGVVTPKFRCVLFVRLLSGMELFLKFLCVCVQGVKSGSLEKPSSAESSPLLPVVEKAGFPPAAFPKENYSCLFFHTCVCLNCLWLCSHVGILGQSVHRAPWRTSSSKQNQEG